MGIWKLKTQICPLVSRHLHNSSIGNLGWIVQIFLIVFSNGVARWPRGGGDGGRGGAWGNIEGVDPGTSKAHCWFGLVFMGFVGSTKSISRPDSGLGGRVSDTLGICDITRRWRRRQGGWFYRTTSARHLWHRDLRLETHGRTDGWVVLEKTSRRSLTQSPLLQCFVVARFVFFFSSPLRATRLRRSDGSRPPP